jgi:Ca2+-binding RTX toxin-like protein
MGVWTPGPAATAGADTFTGDGTAETADGLGGDDALNGNGGDDHLIGGEGNDVINGGGGTDTLDGGGGNDVFIQTTEPFVDVISGGSDFGFSPRDLIDYGFASEGVIVQLSGYATTNDAAHILIATFTGIESVRGTSFNDALIGDS